MEPPLLRPRGFADADGPRIAPRPLLRQLGRDLSLPADRSAVAVAHRGASMVVEWTLRRVGEPADPGLATPALRGDLVFQLAPGANESLLLERGDWEAERRILFSDSPGDEHVERFPPQYLQGGWAYDVEFTTSDERRVLDEERSRQRRAPRRVTVPVK